MNSNSTFSLSLQKQIENQNVFIDSEINRAFNELNFRTLLNRSGITKTKAYAKNTLLFLIFFLPFLKRRLSDFWNSNYLENQINAQKNGINFFPLDVAFNTSSKRFNSRVRNIDKRTNGWHRRKEALGKKTTTLVQMVDRAWKAGIDAAVACYSMIVIRYLLLVYIIDKRRCHGPIGPLFRQISDDHTLLLVADKLWADIKELIIRSSHIICYKIEPDIILHLLDIVEDNIIAQTRLLTAKL